MQSEFTAQVHETALHFIAAFSTHSVTTQS